MNGEECDCEGEPLTSTISMVLDVTITNDGRFLLSADRDEKIRVSRYPQAFVVQSFCLGHDAYVSSLAQSGTRVFSCGGDGVVHEWDIQNGQSIAHSVKLGDEPLRKLRILSVGESFEIVTVGGCTIFRLDDKLNLIKSFKTPSEIMDMTIQDMKLIAISNSGVHLVEADTGNVRDVTITNDLSDALDAARDPISNYFKNVTHQNMVDYFKRKVRICEKFAF
ncbi:unnamed protein product [Cylicostephanus goldi]|uniref:Uncharacterized protein n=1 Tax=Cylicostephanus goldi TaxID=71465 RepID=A0A3P7PS14_CYLGO|nr:unnamed protein product [Cylicostephanus goldi]